MTNAHNLQFSIISYIHGIKYISDGRRLEAPTVANGVERSNQVHIKCPRLYVLGHEDQSNYQICNTNKLLSTMEYVKYTRSEDL